MSYCAATKKNVDSKTAIISPHGTAAALFHMGVLSQILAGFTLSWYSAPHVKKTCEAQNWYTSNPQSIELLSSQLIFHTPHYWRLQASPTWPTALSQVSCWSSHWISAWCGASRAISITLNCICPALVLPCRGGARPNAGTKALNLLFFFVLPKLLCQPCPTLSWYSIVCPLEWSSKANTNARATWLIRQGFVIRAGRDWQIRRWGGFDETTRKEEGEEGKEEEEEFVGVSWFQRLPERPSQLGPSITSWPLNTRRSCETSSLLEVTFFSQDFSSSADPCSHEKTCARSEKTRVDAKHIFLHSFAMRPARTGSWH